MSTDLVEGLRADLLRSDPDAMRAGLATVAERGAAAWAGPLPGLVDALHTVARLDLCLARLVEGHADALRILDQARAAARPGVYGVWASRSVGTGLRARRAAPGWRIEGELRFASGVGLIDRALVPVWTGDGHHRLLDLDVAGLPAERGPWTNAGMDASRSFTVTVDTTVPEEDAVGGVDFYLDRPGFAVGGLGPAAVWAGGLDGLVDAVTRGLRHFVPTGHQLRRLGRLEQLAWQARTTVASVAVALEVGLEPEDAATEVGQARAAVVEACDAAALEAARVVGPGGLTTDLRIARTLADLAVYVRQHHTDAEAEAAGARALQRREVLG